MRKLIFGLTYINSLEKVELTEMWLQLLKYFNPDCDIVLIDTPAEPSFARLVPSLKNLQQHMVAEGSPLPDLQPGVNWISFTDNIGHLSLTGQDGWSRAFCRGVQIALEQNYDYVAHIEGDILCRLKFDDVIAQMQRHNLGTISTIATKWNFMEIGLIFMNCDYLREVEFQKKYDWRTSTKDTRRERPEHKIAEALRGRLLFELWYGGRDENDEHNGLFHEDEMPELYFFTHARRRNSMHAFIKHHAPALGWQPLFPELSDVQ